jgi:hypothetical protein
MPPLRSAAAGSLVTAFLLAAGSGPAPWREPPPPHQPTFEDRVLDAAAHYKEWHRVSDQANWAPSKCRAPYPEGAQVSQSTDDATHGQKLYFLFAKDAEAYTRLAAARDDKGLVKLGIPPVAAGQVLVKESWTYKEVDRASVPRLPDSGQPGHRAFPPEYAFAGEKAYRTDARAGLFVMLKLDPTTPGTDEGWVYATVSPRNTVTSIGKVASCMECHVKNTVDRQFGPPWSRPKVTPPAAPRTPVPPATSPPPARTEPPSR